MTDRPIDRESPSEERCARCGRSRNAAIHEGKCACGCRQSEHWADGGECVNDCDCLCFHPAPAPVSDPKGEGHDIVGQAFCRCCRRVVVDDLPCMPQFKWTAPDSHHWMGDVKIDAPMEPADRRHDIYVTDNGRVFDGCDAGCNGKEIILSRRSTVTPAEARRCLVTGNMCGTDTMQKGTVCLCAPCRAESQTSSPTVTPAEERIETFAYQIHESFHVGCPSEVRPGCIDFIKRKLTRFLVESQTSSPAITEGSARERGPHDWTHAADDCDEPGCDHITRRTCEGAEKTIKFLRDLLAKRTARLANADPAWAAQAARNVFRAVGYTDEEIDAMT
jgi:hypothetical protein